MNCKILFSMKKDDEKQQPKTPNNYMNDNE